MWQEKERKPAVPKGPVWHRTGWAPRSPGRKDAADQQDSAPRIKVVPTNAEREQRFSGGPVAIRTHTHVFAHSRVMQHMHRTVLSRTWCPGLHGSPAADPNTGFFTELDVRLHNMHNSLAAVNRRSRAVQREQEERSAAAPDESGPNLLQLRRAVNVSLDTQMDFFTRCMASYSLEERACACTCPECNCTCRQTDRMLKNLIYNSA